MKKEMNYYLVVKAIQDAAKAIDTLSFMKVIDPSILSVQITNIDRINLTVGPASKDDDFSKGVMIYIGGRFTPDEMKEIEGMSKHADKSVTRMVAKFVAKQAVSFQNQDKSATHMLLG